MVQLADVGFTDDELEMQVIGPPDSFLYPCTEYPQALMLLLLCFKAVPTRMTSLPRRFPITNYHLQTTVSAKTILKTLYKMYSSFRVYGPDCPSHSAIADVIKVELTWIPMTISTWASAVPVLHIITWVVAVCNGQAGPQTLKLLYACLKPLSKVYASVAVCSAEVVADQSQLLFGNWLFDCWQQTAQTLVWVPTVPWTLNLQLPQPTHSPVGKVWVMF